MSRRERLCDRPLKRPLDDEARTGFEAEYHRRKHLIPTPTEFAWDHDRSGFSVRSRWASLFVRFGTDRMVVDADLSLAARMMATDQHRRAAVAFLDGIAADLGL